MHVLPAPPRAWDQVLSNPYINASTSGFLGNWYISFNQWAATQTNLTSTGGCYNPLYKRATGNLAGVINTTTVAQQIDGCIPQASFYSLLNQVSLVTLISLMLAANLSCILLRTFAPPYLDNCCKIQFLNIEGHAGFKNSIIQTSGSGTITTAVFSVMQEASAGNDKFTM